MEHHAAFFAPGQASAKRAFADPLKIWMAALHVETDTIDVVEMRKGTLGRREHGIREMERPEPKGGQVNPARLPFVDAAVFSQPEVHPVVNDLEYRRHRQPCWRDRLPAFARHAAQKFPHLVKAGRVLLANPGEDYAVAPRDQLLPLVAALLAFLALPLSWRDCR